LRQDSGGQPPGKEGDFSTRARNTMAVGNSFVPFCLG